MIKKGDTVIVIAGKDRGRSGKVIQAIPREGRVVIAGVNVARRAERPRRSGQKGQIVEKPMPLHVSNVALADPDTGKPTRVGMREIGGKRVRVAKRSGKEI